jgi:pimeloyl-ACP methyl ester carboxylesterase
MQTNVDGISIGYTEKGQGVPLVFVHGFPLNRECWRLQVDSLSGICRTVALDLRGFGSSDATSGTTTMDRFADDIAALLGDLDAGPAILVGHSMGGYVTLAFARRHADLLRGLVLVATRAGQDSPEAAAGRRATAEKVRAEGARVVIDGMAPKMLASGNEDAAMQAAVRGFMEPASRDGVIGALLGMAERPDSTPMLEQIEVPTLVVTGDGDLVIDPAESQTLTQAIPGSQLHVIPDAGHLVAYEKAENFNAILRDWVKIAVT